jgi:hypothetical protein
VNARPGPGAARQLRAARDVVLAAVAGGAPAARAALAELPAGQLLDVAAILALYAGQPETVVLTTEEWNLAAAALRTEP